MLNYPFTNDMRPDNLLENLKIAANYAEKNLKGSDKSTLNVSNTLKIYFGLGQHKVNTEMILHDNYEVVILECIKKFQFPYPRTQDTLNEQLDAHLNVAPMRDLVKVLFFKYVSNIGRLDADNTVSIEQFKNYMLADEEYVTGKKDVHQIFENIIQNKKVSFSYKNDVKVSGGGKERMPQCMFKIVSQIPWIIRNKDKISLDFSKAKKDDKFWEIINYKKRWQFDLNEEDFNQIKNSYIDYMQIEHSVFKGGNNTIYYGAPGTGKSYQVSEYIKKNFIPNYSPEKGHPDVFRTTLHSEYSYYDFIGQLLPEVDQNNVTYKFNPGVFTTALKHAIKNPERPIFLILEEMSRANVSAVFGDIFQLLDRDENGKSVYTINNGLIAKNVFSKEVSDYNKCNIYIPKNLFIIGTVNTSDQNVFAMDTAFKRRFIWKYVSPKINRNMLNDNNPKITMSSNLTISWYDFYNILNKFIVCDLKLNEDKQIGPYFIKFNKSIKPEELIREKLLQYLWEDVNEVGKHMNNENCSLFDNKISSFSDLYSSFGNKCIFSKQFKDKINYKSDDENDNGQAKD